MIARLVAVAICVLPLPALARADDLYARGAALRIGGHPAEAVRLLRAASRLHPENADIWLNLGLAYTAIGDFVKAQRTLETAARLTPDSVDVQVGLARLAFFREEYERAERLLAGVEAIQPGYPDAVALRAQVTAARQDANAHWRLDANFNYGWVSNDLPSARGATVVLARRVAPGLTLSGGVDVQRQFNTSDTYFEAVAAGRAGYIALGATPDADFRPEFAVRAGGMTYARPLMGDWTVQFGADGGWARYPAGEVLTLSPLAMVSLADAFSLSARWINVIDETDRHRMGYQLKGSWRPAPKVSLSAGYADAPESSQGVTIDVRAVSLGVTYDIDDRTMVRLGAEHAARAVYDRTDLIVGFMRRF